MSSGLVCAEDEEGNKTCEEPSNFELWDLSRPLDGDCEIEYCTISDKEGKTVFWHSSAHILGSSLEHTYGGHLCIGPALEEGFYYDIYMGKNSVDEKEYPKIEENAKAVITANHPYSRLTLSKSDALELFGENPFKVQLIKNKIPENGKTTAYKCGDLIDLCMGPHLISTGIAKSFKVTKNSSCYWLGNAQNDSLQRVYGVSFPNVKEMEVKSFRITFYFFVKNYLLNKNKLIYDRNILKEKKRKRSVITDILVSNKIYLCSTIYLPVLASSIPTELTFITNLLALSVKNIQLEASLKLFLLISITCDYGKLLDITRTTKIICLCSKLKTKVN